MYHASPEDTGLASCIDIEDIIVLETWSMHIHNAYQTYAGFSGGTWWCTTAALYGPGDLTSSLHVYKLVSVQW